MKLTGEDVGRRAEALFLACAIACLAAQARAQDLTAATNLTAQSIASRQASWNRLSLQGVNLAGTNAANLATSRAMSLRTGFATAATVLSTASAELLTCALSNDLIVWWTFEEGGGGSLMDASGNGYSASLVGGPLPIWTKGVTSDALDFDCAQNFVGSDQVITQTFTAATLECWFRADCVSGENPSIVGTVHDDNPIYGQGDIGSLNIYSPDVRPDMGYALYFAVGNNWMTAPINAFDGQYHHVAGVWDDSGMQLYYDGVLAATTNATIGPVEGNSYLRAAYRDTNGGCFLGGMVGETRLYDRALSSAEVAADYNTDTVGDGIPDWWRMKYFGSGTTTNNQSCATCDPYGIGINNSTAYLEGRDPTKQAVPDTNAVVNLIVYTPLE